MSRFHLHSDTVDSYPVDDTLGGGKVIISRMGQEFQVARFALNGNLIFVTHRPTAATARRLAKLMAETGQTKEIRGNSMMTI